MIPTEKNYGPLSVLEQIDNPHGPAIILLHGYGVNANDLFPLHYEIGAKKRCRWYFPNGPEETKAYPGGRAWYSIPENALADLSPTKSVREIPSRASKKMISSRDKIFELLKLLKLNPSQTIIGGFSQGAMLATDIVMHSKEPFAGLIIMSGSLQAEDEWKQLASLHPNQKFLQCHGTNDLVLALSQAKTLFDRLIEARWQGGFFEFEGGHDIPKEVTKEIRQFINSVLP